MLCWCVLCSVHWPFVFCIIYPCLENVFKLRFYLQLCHDYGNPENSSKSSWENASLYLFFFFFLIRKKHGLKHLRVKPTDTLHIHTLSSVHPASARFCLLLAHADSSPVVPSHGTGTILLCGSPAGPGQGKHPSPCCFEAVKK